MPTDNLVTRRSVAPEEDDRIPAGTETLFEQLRREIEAIDHPCHDVCIGDLHADCQCAAWIRQEVLAIVDRLQEEAAAGAGT